MFEVPPVRWVSSDDASVAYQRFGDGPVDLLVVHGVVSHVEAYFELPGFKGFAERLGQIARVLHVDKRGSGLSDRFAGYPPIEARVDDLRAVLDQEGIERAWLMGDSEGGTICTVAAAVMPERLSGLILVGSFPRFVQGDGYPYGPTSEAMLESVERDLHLFGDPSGRRHAVSAPDHADNDELARIWAWVQRMSMSPTAWRRAWELIAEMDTRAVLPAIKVPTLVLHRTGDRVAPLAAGRYLADHIPGARLVELDGNDHWMWMGDTDTLLSHVAEFIGATAPAVLTSRTLGTVAFIDIVDSTRLATELGDSRWRSRLDEFDQIVSQQLARYAGRLVKSTGDGALVLFDGPARAIGCVMAISAAAQLIGLRTRAGVHTGEIELRGDDVAGLTVHVAARIEAHASPGGVAVSSIAKDLAAGSGINFEPLGEHHLKGVDGEWQLHQPTNTPTLY